MFDCESAKLLRTEGKLNYVNYTNKLKQSERKQFTDRLTVAVVTFE